MMRGRTLLRSLCLVFITPGVAAGAEWTGFEVNLRQR